MSPAPGQPCNPSSAAHGAARLRGRPLPPTRLQLAAVGEQPPELRSACCRRRLCGGGGGGGGYNAPAQGLCASSCCCTLRLVWVCAKLSPSIHPQTQAKTTHASVGHFDRGVLCALSSAHAHALPKLVLSATVPSPPRHPPRMCCCSRPHAARGHPLCSTLLVEAQR